MEWKVIFDCPLQRPRASSKKAVRASRERAQSSNEAILFMAGYDRRRFHAVSLHAAEK
jgi:hypothetical protein